MCCHSFVRTPMQDSFLSTSAARFKPYYLYRLVKWKLGDRPPMGVCLKVTARCPMECRHCAWHRSPEPELSTEEWFRLINEARRRGCIFALFEGGEPTMRDDLRELMDHARSRGMITELFTNGWNAFHEYVPDAFRVSVDGVGEIHDWLRTPGSFDRLIENVERVVRKNVISWTTVTRYSMGHLDELCGYLSGRVSGMMFNFFYPYD